MITSIQYIKYLLVGLACLLSLNLRAQMAEAYAGDERAGVDIMWFRYFKKDSGANSPWLFFSRVRASVNYHNQPLWGTTNAVSYNFSSGWAVVGVGALGAAGFIPKVGVQFSGRSSNFLFFGWLVAETASKPDIDLFMLGRYTPRISARLKLFLQLEASQVFPGRSSRPYNFVQRLRLGLQWKTWQSGFIMDWSEVGRRDYTVTHNLGIFLRHEF